MQSEIKRWGNSAAVRLSRDILAQARLDVASPISIDVKVGKIVIGTRKGDRFNFLKRRVSSTHIM